LVVYWKYWECKGSILKGYGKYEKCMGSMESVRELYGKFIGSIGRELEGCQLYGKYGKCM